MDTILTVRELNHKLNQVLEARFPYIWIKGEVTNCVRASSGHIYFSLKDEQDLLNCVWFKRCHQDLSFDPLTGECFEENNKPAPKPSLAHKLRDGQEIVCAGRLAIYGARGQYQLIVEHALESGIGQLYEAFEKLKQKLSAEGLFDNRYKKPIPAKIRNLALITAPTGAVIHDFLRIAQSRGIKSTIHIFPSLVQGADAPHELILALKKAQEHVFPNGQQADCIVLVRGGGSIQDLWAFNDEELARALFACPIPIVTGIGHEPDFTIADYVSDKSLATPSHAAQFLWKDKDSLIQNLDDLEYTLKALLEDLLRHKEKEIHFLSRHLEFVSPKNKVLEKRLRIQNLSFQLQKNFHSLLAAKENQLFYTKQRIKQHIPRFSALENFLTQYKREMRLHVLASLGQNENRLIQLNQKLKQIFRQHIQKKEFSLQKAILILEGSNPQKPLEKGYIFAENQRNNKTIKSVQDIQVNDILTLYAADGTVQTKVEQINPTIRQAAQPEKG